MLLWQMIKDSKIVQGLIGFGVFLFGTLTLINKGKKINQAKVDEQARKRDEATRERRDRANEKINSSDSSVNDWLHKHDRFRD